MIGIRIGLERRRRPPTLPAVTTDPGVTAIRAEGWSVDFTAPPTMDPANAPRIVALTRQGFTTAGAATSLSETLVLTQRVRQPYPNQALLTPGQVSLSDYVYATDTVIGSAANNSTEVSPKPIAAWALPDRRVVGNSLSLAIVAAHRNARNGEPVACVVFTATDGSSTVSATIGASSILSHPSDQNPVVGYAATLDISALAGGPVVANAKVYPWVGDTTSVLDSAATAAGTRAFCPQLFTRNAAYAAAPPLAYVSPSGTDAAVLASGATAGGAQKVTTDPAAAAANPFATIGSAMVALKAATTVTGGRTDGCRIRLMAGSNAPGAPTAQTYQSAADLVIEADPLAAPGTASLDLAANWATRHTYLRFKNLVINRTSSAQISVNANSFVTLENVTYVNTALNFALCSGGSAGNPVVLRALGLSVTGSGGTTTLLGASTGFECRLLRGVTGSGFNLDNACVLASVMTNSTTAASTAYADTGSFIGFNKIMAYTGASTPLATRVDGSAPDIGGMALIQNVVEWSGTGNNAAFKLSADSGHNNTVHVVMHHNTFAGYWNYGRTNALYNETNGMLRNHRLASFKGNIHVALNTKHDVFFAVNSGNPDGTANIRTGGWAYLYGVGCAGELVQYADANSARNGTGSSFSQTYAGLDAACGASTTVALDPLFLAPACTTWSGTGTTPTAGVGIGSYGLKPGSPAAGRLARPVLRFDLSGATRPESFDASGAYRA